MNIIENIKKFLNNKQQKTLSPEELKRKELLSKIYNKAYIFQGEYEKEITLDNHNIKYCHSEFFLANSQSPCASTQFIRLTGENINGKPLKVVDIDNWKLGKRSGIVLYVEDEGIKYTMSHISMDASYLNNHTISGYRLRDLNNEFNTQRRHDKLEKLEEQENIDALFRK